MTLVLSICARRSLAGVDTESFDVIREADVDLAAAVDVDDDLVALA
jgi:hypothetical protein